jgi:hypothetical protein
VLPSVFEGDPGTHDEVGDGTRDEHLARSCDGTDPRADVNGQAAGTFI